MFYVTSPPVKRACSEWIVRILAMIVLPTILALVPGCHDAAPSATGPVVIQADDALPTNLPNPAPLFATIVVPPSPLAPQVDHAPLPPRPTDAGNVAQQALQPASAPPPSTSLDALSPNAGLIVCDPVSAMPSLVDFGTGCGRWLDLIAAGQDALGRTPMWEARDRILQEMGRTNLRLTPAEANALVDITGVPYAACGRLEGTAAHCTLTYQIYALPGQRPVGAPLVQTGTQAQVMAALPALARGLDARLGLAIPMPAPVGVAPDDLTRLGAMTHAAILSDADLLALSGFSARCPLAGMVLLETRAVNDQIVLNRTVKELMTEQPNNTLALSHIGYVSAPALRPYAAASAALIRRFPKNALLAHTEVWEQRVWGTRDREWKAAQRTRDDSPQDPECWLSPGQTLGYIAQDLRQGRLSRDLTPLEWDYLNRLYARQESSDKEATRLDPRFGHAWYQFAQAATFAGDPAQAAAAFQQALKLDPYKAEVYAWGLQMFQQKWGGDPASLDRVATLAAALPYDDTNAAIDVSESLASVPDSKYAAMAADILSRRIAAAREDVRKQPSDAMAHWDLAGALAEQKDSPDLIEATREYRIAAHLMPNAPSLHYWLAHVLDQRHRGREAVAELRQTLALDPFYPQAHYDLGYDLKGQHLFPEALTELRLAMRLDPRNADAHYGLGVLLDMQNQPKPAMVEYREALRMTPYFPQAAMYLARDLDNAGQYDAAISEDHEALRLDSLLGSPDPELEVGAHDTLADAYLHKKAWDASLAETQAALAISPDDPIAHENVAEAYWGQGRKAEARAEWERVLTLGDPDAAETARKLLAEHP